MFYLIFIDRYREIRNKAEEKLDAGNLMILNHKEANRFLVDNIDKLVVSIDNRDTLIRLLFKIIDIAKKIECCVCLYLDNRSHHL